ncbi:acyl-CoA thioesterase [Pseudorhizobium endolithicum]|uniref:Acyl-CoA thioesterase n=1 Tax=Pseudorhizobium endolithicum TaxID=1191678 RepID=A0ABN7JZM3_9HYPH|nr:acyl-CoA thioesterase [Rhizobium sp. Q54]CAD7052839.1 acyl-CoA thioesterase [Pseudorhizobium endolithicum]
MLPVRLEGAVDKEPADFIEFQVPFRDVDLHGEMFKSVYLARAEEALASFWKRRPAAADDLHFTVGKITCTFHAALRLHDHVRMDVHVSKIGVKSAGFLVRMVREGDSDAVAEAEILWVSCDRQSKEPVALPEDLRDWLYEFLD